MVLVGRSPDDRLRLGGGHQWSDRREVMGRADSGHHVGRWDVRGIGDGARRRRATRYPPRVQIGMTISTRNHDSEPRPR